VGVPTFQGADRGPRAHLGRGCEPVGGSNFSVPHSVILSFYSAVDGGPQEVPELMVRECLPSMLRNNDDGPLERRCRRSGSTHHQRKKHQQWALGPCGGGGSDLHQGSKRCVVNLHEYERQKVILLMGPTFPAPGPAMAYDP
jgi:hypothetical protein